MTTLTLTSVTRLGADAVVVGLTRSSTGQLGLAEGAAEVDEALEGRLLQLATALGATGRAGDTTKVAAVGGRPTTPVVLLVGLGEAPDAGRFPAETLRRAAGEAVRALAGSARVALALPAGEPAEVVALAEGALLGAYRFDAFRTVAVDSHRPPVRAVSVVTPLARNGATRAGVARARVLAAAVHAARDLVNTPASALHPQDLAATARRLAAGTAIRVRVLDERGLRRGGYGGHLAVGAGSVNPPRLVRLSYDPPGARAHLALVGKGITFDSGGLSLKPAASMDTMKSDMAGAAAVITAVRAIADLRLPVRVTGWAACAENMPSGSAMRPSDVITIRGGRTVEVLNTDAEGRLVLADALVAASEESPDIIVDVATLTGAQVVALGPRVAAVMANDDALRTQVCAVAEQVGEAFWPMPLPDELRKGLDSTVADIANMGERWGGMLTAGVFLREFVGSGLRWAHVDMAGPAFNEGEAHGYTPRGGTGAGVRTLVGLAEELAAQA